MNIVICTTPIRPVPTSYPPYGSLAVIQALRAAGYDPYFYDIDGLRPSFAEVEAFFRERRPDVVGISAVVSTAYGYNKQLIQMLRHILPDTRIVLGGNLAASAEILHRLAGVDVCVIGEGEVVSVNLMRAFEHSRSRVDVEALSGVRGITFLRADGQMVMTGYETALPPGDVFNPDFSILERYAKMETFLTSPFTQPHFLLDPRSHEPHRKGKKMFTLLTTKGCVARCTFCHRWDKGYRAIPVDQIIAKIEEVKRRYDVGFISFGDENFGSDKRQVEELLLKLKPLDMLWSAAGVRVRTVNPDLLRRMKEAGCVSLFYGMETGSPDILETMEKKAALENNLNAARWTREAGLFTIYQMIVGMPGETEKTIRETTDFLKAVTQDSPHSPRSLMSINYIQALPGTPVYEYARSKGLIGKSLADEEKYLLSISDINAEDDTKTLNFTESDYLTLRSWRRRMVLEVMRHYHVHNRTPVPSLWALFTSLFKKKILSQKDHNVAGAELQQVMVQEYSQGGYFNLARDLGYDVIVAYFYPFRNLVLAAWLLQDEFRRLPFSQFARHVLEWLSHRLRPSRGPGEPAASLRQVMTRLAPAPQTLTERAMQPLREGR